MCAHNKLENTDAGTGAQLFRLQVFCESPQRLDVYCSGALSDTDLTREKIKELIKVGKVTVNGRTCTRPSAKVNAQDWIELVWPVPDANITPHDAPLKLLYQDADLAVVNKPAGLTVHPAPSCREPTLVHRLVHHFPDIAGQETDRPGIVHRLDKDTSGLILVALNQRTSLALAQDFAARRIHKEYLAMVYGLPPAKGSCRLPIGRHPTKKVLMAVVEKGGKEAHTEYEVLYAAPDKLWSLLRVRIHTGRTHQIRVHLSHLGHPIIGDALYARKNAVPDGTPARLHRLAKRQLLHAWHLNLLHPQTGGELDFYCPPPKDFLHSSLLLSRTRQRVVLTGMPGCGKSTVLRVCREQGVPTISADAVVAKLYEPGNTGWEFVRNRFGEAFLAGDAQDAPVDKKKLFLAMRTNTAVRDEIAATIHPMVRHRLEEFWDETRHARVAVAEIPLVLEAGWKSAAADVLVGIFCPYAIRYRRLAELRGWDDEMIAAMDSWQWPEQRKMRACDLIVDNSGDLDALRTRSLGLLEALQYIRRAKSRGLADLLHGLYRETNDRSESL